MAKLIKKNEAIVIIEREKEIDTSTEWGDGFLSGLNAIEENLALLETVTEAEIRASAIDEFAEKLNKKITDFVLEHQSQLTFVSGVSMGWKFVDEIAEQLKEE